MLLSELEGLDMPRCIFIREDGVSFVVNGTSNEFFDLDAELRKGARILRDWPTAFGVMAIITAVPS